MGEIKGTNQESAPTSACCSDSQHFSDLMRSREDGKQSGRSQIISALDTYITEVESRMSEPRSLDDRLALAVLYGAVSRIAREQEGPEQWNPRDSHCTACGGSGLVGDQRRREIHKKAVEAL